MYRTHTLSMGDRRLEQRPALSSASSVVRVDGDGDGLVQSTGCGSRTQSYVCFARTKDCASVSAKNILEDQETEEPMPTTRDHTTPSFLLTVMTLCWYKITIGKTAVRRRRHSEKARRNSHSQPSGFATDGTRTEQARNWRPDATAKHCSCRQQLGM